MEINLMSTEEPALPTPADPYRKRMGYAPIAAAARAAITPRGVILGRPPYSLDLAGIATCPNVVMIGAETYWRANVLGQQSRQHSPAGDHGHSCVDASAAITALDPNR